MGVRTGQEPASPADPAPRSAHEERDGRGQLAPIEGPGTDAKSEDAKTPHVGVRTGQEPASPADPAPRSAHEERDDRSQLAPIEGPDAASPSHPLTRSPAHLFDAFLRWGAILLLFIALPLSFLALLLTQGDETAFLRASLASLAVALATACWLGTWAVIAARRRGMIGAQVAATLLIGLLFFDLAAGGAYTDISDSDPTLGFQHPEIVAFLRADPDLFRIDTDTDIAALWQPDTAALYGLQDVSGVANPLLLRSMRDFQQSTGGRGTRRYDLLNVKYVIVRAGTPLPEGKFVRVLGPVGELEVYENLDFAPRAWWSPADVELANVELPDEPAAAAVTSYTNSAFTVAVDAPAEGYLILSETWYPGWRATVNGVETPVEQVNGVFRAVRVPAGESVVEMRYWPWAYGG
jgi:hypothetical protein